MQLEEVLSYVGTKPDLTFEVSELRKEISMLRVELSPVKSLIVTGQQVIDEFKRITGKD